MSTLTNEQKNNNVANNIEKKSRAENAVGNAASLALSNNPAIPNFSQPTRSEVLSARTRAIFNTRPTGVPIEKQRNILAGISPRPGYYIHICEEKDVQKLWNAGYTPVYNQSQDGGNEKNPSQMGEPMTVVLNPQTGHLSPGSTIGVVMEIPEERWRETQQKQVAQDNALEEGMLSPEANHMYGEIQKGKRTFYNNKGSKR